MKKIFYFLIILCINIIISCNVDRNLSSDSQTVTLKLNYVIDDIITRTNNNELYLQIYNKIISRELIAPEYTLKFTNKETGETFNLSGKLNSNELISIKTGSYKITGSANATGEGLQDKCSIKFDTEATITTNSSILTLKADYNCFLLIFDKSIINDAYITYLNVGSSLVEKHFFEFNNTVYYGFSHKLYNENGNTSSQRLIIKYNNNQTVEVFSNKLNTKNGEYYIFNEYNMPSTITYNWQSLNFTLNEMTCGRL